MVFKCCVPGCKNYQKDAQMHIFPKNQELYNVWIKRIGHPNLQEMPMEKVQKSYRVCNVHFGPDAQYIGLINKSTIKKDAIPSLFLPPINNTVMCSYEKETKRILAMWAEIESDDGIGGPPEDQDDVLENNDYDSNSEQSEGEEIPDFNETQQDLNTQTDAAPEESPFVTRKSTKNQKTPKKSKLEEMHSDLSFLSMIEPAKIFINNHELPFLLNSEQLALLLDNTAG
ncbi:unnamed protein product [Diabrotica balteata]|uniref:THAP-type domain-containing protein n=1 Tax=Diabrotica balteata TaxID=107213 RepID=A0A9N9T5A1_DIABA|nr:unnamed protein product [Diabrotica balteata]